MPARSARRSGACASRCHSRPRVGVTVEQLRGLLLRDVVDAVVQHRAPVPSVPRRVRHERIETRAEGERGDDDDHADDGAQDRGAHRGGLAAVPGLDREADAGHRRRRERRGRGGAGKPGWRASRPGAPLGFALWCAAVGHDQRDRGQCDGEHGEPGPSTVQSNAKPDDDTRVGRRPMGARGDNSTATAAARTEPLHL